MICKSCGKMITFCQGKIIDHEFYCDDCIVKCDNCGEYVLEENSSETDNGDVICKECKDNEYSICEHCGALLRHEDLIEIQAQGIWVCQDCANKHYYECECCGKYFVREDGRETFDNHWVCDDCCTFNYRICDDCGYAVHIDVAEYSESDEVDYCPDCAKEHPDCIYGYHEYDAFHKLKTKEEINPNEYFGLEIEVSGNRTYADEFLNIVPNVVLMSDSSIEDGGFEIVTEPMTRKFLNDVFLPNLEKGMQFLNLHYFCGHNRGGIHIHVSQEVFSKEMLCALNQILYSEIENDFEVWKAISQRQNSEIQQWCKFKDSYSCKEILESDDTYPPLSESRYTALNYDSRTKTYEFRIFNSNTRIERIKKNLQTVYSLIDYSTKKSNDYRFATTIGYIDFVLENKETYPDLHEFLYEMGIVQRLNEERMAA